LGVLGNTWALADRHRDLPLLQLETNRGESFQVAIWRSLRRIEALKKLSDLLHTGLSHPTHLVRYRCLLHERVHLGVASLPIFVSFDLFELFGRLQTPALLESPRARAHERAY